MQVLFREKFSVLHCLLKKLSSCVEFVIFKGIGEPPSVMSIFFPEINCLYFVPCPKLDLKSENRLSCTSANCMGAVLTAFKKGTCTDATVIEMTTQKASNLKKDGRWRVLPITFSRASKGVDSKTDYTKLKKRGLRRAGHVVHFNDMQ